MCVCAYKTLFLYVCICTSQVYYLLNISCSSPSSNLEFLSNITGGSGSGITRGGADTMKGLGVFTIY